VADTHLFSYVPVVRELLTQSLKCSFPTIFAAFRSWLHVSGADVSSVRADMRMNIGSDPKFLFLQEIESQI
jgi:hypothetical protein